MCPEAEPQLVSEQFQGFSNKPCQLDIISRINELQSNGPGYFIFSDK